MTSLSQGMRRLVEDMGMLTGLTVCFGTARHSSTHTLGLAREVVLKDGDLVEDPRALNENTLYDLASLTKVFTAVAVMQLMERGRLRLDDYMGERDDRFPMLRGTAIVDMLTYEAILRTPQRVSDQPDVASARSQVFATYRYHGPEPPKLYSDMNALVLKYLVERVSGKGYYQYLKDHVLSPCGMNETWAQVPEHRLADCMDYNFERRLLHGQHEFRRQDTSGLPHDPKARLLSQDGADLCGHAGLFSTAGDMVRFAQGLLRGQLLRKDTLENMGQNRTGRLGPPYRQYLGWLVFAKSPVQRLSEVPQWMGNRAFGISGYTGNHLAVDPELGVFDLFLGNRCHNRLTTVMPQEGSLALGLADSGVGSVLWPDGRQVRSSVRYYHFKDSLLHQPVYQQMRHRRWIGN